MNLTQKENIAEEQRKNKPQPFNENKKTNNDRKSSTKITGQKSWQTS